MPSRCLSFLILLVSLLFAAFSTSAITRPTGYGAVPGYRPLALGGDADISLASAWRGRWVDITGYHQIGLRPYDSVSGRWLSSDSVWNERDPNYYTFCGGDPVNGFDSDGRCVDRGIDSAADALNWQATQFSALVNSLDTQTAWKQPLNYASSAVMLGLADMASILDWAGVTPDALASIPMMAPEGRALGAVERTMASVTTETSWVNRFPGVQVRQYGDYWAKRVNPNSSPLMQSWGELTIQRQSSALEALEAAGRPAANSRLFPSGRLVVEDVGTPLGYGSYLNPSYWGARFQDSRAMGTFLNDLRPGNYGAGFRAFDPALDPIQAAIGIGAGTAIGWGVYEATGN